jgi:hypothetical protein
MIRRLFGSFVNRLWNRPAAGSWLAVPRVDPHELRRQLAQMQSVDASDRSWPVLLELKVDLRTQRDREQFTRLTRFCRDAAGTLGVFGYLDAERLAIWLPRAGSDEVAQLTAQLQSTWGVEVLRLRIDAVSQSTLPVVSGGQPGGTGRRIVRLGERAAAAAGLVLFSPLLLLLALTVRITSPGPVLEVRERLGHDGRRCRVYRFRAQPPSASSHGRKASPRDPADDGRFGRRARHLSLDRLLTETRLHRLPQLWNVLRGELPLRSVAGSPVGRSRPRGKQAISERGNRS